MVLFLLYASSKTVFQREEHTEFVLIQKKQTGKKKESKYSREVTFLLYEQQNQQKTEVKLLAANCSSYKGLTKTIFLRTSCCSDLYFVLLGSVYLSLKWYMFNSRFAENGLETDPI